MDTLRNFIPQPEIWSVLVPVKELALDLFIKINYHDYTTYSFGFFVVHCLVFVFFNCDGNSDLPTR